MHVRPFEEYVPCDNAAPVVEVVVEMVAAGVAASVTVAIRRKKELMINGKTCLHPTCLDSLGSLTILVYSWRTGLLLKGGVRLFYIGTTL